jgi:hypothetical protein
VTSPGLTWTHLISLGFTWTHLISLDLTWIHLDSLDLIWIPLISFISREKEHLISQGKRERPVGQKGKGKGAAAAADHGFGAGISLGIQTARARTHDTKRFPGWTHPPTSDIYIYIFIYLKSVLSKSVRARACTSPQKSIC